MMFNFFFSSSHFVSHGYDHSASATITAAFHQRHIHHTIHHSIRDFLMIPGVRCTLDHVTPLSTIVFGTALLSSIRLDKARIPGVFFWLLLAMHLCEGIKIGDKGRQDVGYGRLGVHFEDEKGHESLGATPSFRASDTDFKYYNLPPQQFFEHEASRDVYN